MIKKILKGLLGLAVLFISPMAMVLLGFVGFVIYQLSLGIPVSQSVLDFKQLLLTHGQLLVTLTKWGMIGAFAGLLWKQRLAIRKWVGSRLM